MNLVSHVKVAPLNSPSKLQGATQWITSRFLVQPGKSHKHGDHWHIQDVGSKGDAESLT